MPEIPATREAEAGELLDRESEVAVSRDPAAALQPDDRVRLSKKKKKVLIFSLQEKYAPNFK